MPINQAMCSSFKGELLQALHNFNASGGHTFKLALYSDAATLNANTTAYSATNEVTHANYTAGGASLTNLGVTVTNTNATAGVGFTSFDTVTFANVSLTARGCLIYNTSSSNRAVAVFDFGTDKTASNGNFVINFPANNSTNAVIRFA